jgi:hypothetical protein
VPTHQSLFPDWDSFDDEDLALVRRALMPLGEFPHRFVLWLPLRSQLQLTHDARRVDPIISHYPDPYNLIDRLCNSTILAECLPMLAHLEAINVHHVGPAAGWRTLVTCALPKKINRLRRVDSADEQRVELGGRVAVSLNGTSTALDFVGHQTLKMTDRLRVIKSNGAWPTMHLRDDEGLRAIQSKEKASPQGAVMLCRQATTQGASIFTVDWAVFLPVGGHRDEVELRVLGGQSPLANSFHLLLHGYFFLDAGRQSIEGIRDPSLTNLPANEAEVRRSWNTTVRDELVLPNVPEVIAAAVQTLSLSNAEVWALCDAVKKTSVWTRHTEAITSHTHDSCVSCIPRDRRGGSLVQNPNSGRCRGRRRTSEIVRGRSSRASENAKALALSFSSCMMHRI